MSVSCVPPLSRPFRHAPWLRTLVLLALSCSAAAHEARPVPPPAPSPAVSGLTAYTLDLPGTPMPPGAARDRGELRFIGTATVLIRYQGLTILTDPNFLHKGDHVHLGYGLHSKRLTEPAISMAQLPPIDLVVLSHLHEDHFDKLVQQQLNRDTPIVTTAEASEQLERMGFRKRYPLSRWDTLTVRKGGASLTVTATPARHGPPVAAALLPPVMGTLLDFAPAAGKPHYRIYISGDTLVYDDIAQIPRRFPDIDLALLHLGGTRILGVLKVTMDGEDGVRMMRIIAPRRAIPIHYNDYDVFRSPLADFEKAVVAAGLSASVTYLKHGDSYHFTGGD